MSMDRNRTPGEARSYENDVFAVRRCATVAEADGDDTDQCKNDETSDTTEPFVIHRRD